jgi:hypothetical protein
MWPLGPETLSCELWEPPLRFVFAAERSAAPERRRLEFESEFVPPLL